MLALCGDEVDEEAKLVCAGNRVKCVTRPGVHGEQGRPGRLGTCGDRVETCDQAFSWHGESG